MGTALARPSTLVPTLVAEAGPKAKRRFLEFFTAQIRNANTRAAYAQAAVRFSAWCEVYGFELETLDPIAASAYIEGLLHEKELSVSSIKQHLAALRNLCDFLVTGGVLEFNPSAVSRRLRPALEEPRARCSPAAALRPPRIPSVR